MAVSTIIEIATWINAAIKATTPDVRSGIPYRKASGTAPLQEQEPNGRDSQRQFQVQMRPITGLGDFVGPCYELHHDLTVVMRYVMDGRNRDDWDDLQLMAADDAKRIVLALTRPPLSAPWSDAGIFNIIPVDHEVLARNERWEGVWEQSVTFDCLYADEPNTRDFECMTLYPDYATLSATDGTTTWLGQSRPEVRRLTDGTLYVWSATYGWEDMASARVKDPVARAAASLPQTTQTPYFTVTGRCMVLKIIGEVTTVVQAQANSIKLISNPTVGADVDMCAALDINADAVGTLYTVTGTLSDAMVATTSGAVQSQLTGIDVAAGTIDLDATASSTGATKWVVHYVPIDDGATITTA
jgi:hypothetical protein